MARVVSHPFAKEPAKEWGTERVAFMSQDLSVFAAWISRFPHCVQHHCVGQTFGRTTSKRNDAKSAAIAASFLNFQVGTSLHAWPELCFLEKGVGEAVVSPDGGSLRRARREERGYGDKGAQEG